MRGKDCQLLNQEIAEVQATVEMESGDKSINYCFDDLLFTFTNVHPGKADESSPIIKKKAKAVLCPKAKKAKMDSVKVFELGGISIRSSNGEVFSMKNMIQKAEEGGNRMLDQLTGDLIKKIPCGFYPTCNKGLDKNARVMGGVLFEPKGHKKENKVVYICEDHESNLMEGVDGLGDAIGREEGEPAKGEDEEDVLDELETSVMEEEYNTLNEVAAEEVESEANTEAEFLSQSIFQQ